MLPGGKGEGGINGKTGTDIDAGLYVNKSGKLNSGHRTGKGQLSFLSQKRAMLKNAQTTAQLHSFHMLARFCSKSFKLGFSST